VRKRFHSRFAWRLLSPSSSAARRSVINLSFTEAASKNHNPNVIIALLKAGANAKPKNSKGFTAFDYAKANKNLDGTDALKQLEEASK
jgi:ankyrin repeat protein